MTISRRGFLASLAAAVTGARALLAGDTGPAAPPVSSLRPDGQSVAVPFAQVGNVYSQHGTLTTYPPRPPTVWVSHHNGEWREMGTFLREATRVHERTSA